MDDGELLTNKVWKDFSEELVRKCETTDKIKAMARAKKPNLDYWRMYDLRFRDVYRGPMDLPNFKEEMQKRADTNMGVEIQVCGNCGKRNNGRPNYVFCKGCNLQEYCCYQCKEDHAGRHVGVCRRAKISVHNKKAQLRYLKRKIDRVAHAQNCGIAFVDPGVEETAEAVED
jgi:hypothetical protein